ncbi:MAG TPA: FtsX-like permease family protein [Stellaceae bacterium]|nr:FtsX-like permease family protein [Stellaceae bacterium]
MRGRAIDIPFDRDGSGRFLPWLIGVMVYLAALAAAGSLVLDRALESWNRGLEGTLSIELPPPAASGDGGLAAALAALKATDGVRSARALDRGEIARLLEPYLGADLPQQLALPRMIDVKIDPARLDRAALAAKLAAVAPGAVVDDHRVWLDRLATLVRAAEATGLLIVFLIAAAAVATVIFTTRTGLSVHRDVVELLHVIGARDGYIAHQFERQALKLGLAGGGLGLLLAVATLLALAHVGAAAAMLGRTPLPLPGLALAPWHYAVLAALPLAAAVLAMLTARRTVLSALARMP